MIIEGGLCQGDVFIYMLFITNFACSLPSILLTYTITVLTRIAEMEYFGL